MKRRVAADLLSVPEKLMPKGGSLLFLLRAEGVQVYRAEKMGR
jgi:hypothetical protein